VAFLAVALFSETRWDQDGGGSQEKGLGSRGLFHKNACCKWEGLIAKECVVVKSRSKASRYTGAPIA
jgi:hypothetical protein